MGTGQIGNLWRARTHRRRTAFVSVLGLAIVAGALLFPVPALSHDASDFFMFARAEFGDSRKSNELNCDGSNDKQVDVSGSGNTIEGRIHSNADAAGSGSGNTFHNELTFGTHDEDCQVQADSGNTYLAGPPVDIDADPSGVSNEWPGDLSTYLNADTLTFGNDITQVLPGESCDVGSLTNSSDITLTRRERRRRRLQRLGQDLAEHLRPDHVDHHRLPRSDRGQRPELDAASGERTASSRGPTSSSTSPRSSRAAT